jgi:hypothetical protein
MLKRFIGVGVAIVIALGWWGFSTWKAKSDAPEVGKCVTVSGSASDAEVEEADCGGDDVLYEVVADDGKCDPTEVNYTVEVRGSDAVDLCLDWSVEAGDCVKTGSDFDVKVDCDENKGDDTVWQIVEVGDSADGTCPKKSQSAPNQTRDTLICAAPNV